MRGERGDVLARMSELLRASVSGSDGRRLTLSAEARPPGRQAAGRQLDRRLRIGRDSGDLEALQHDAAGVVGFGAVPTFEERDNS